VTLELRYADGRVERQLFLQAQDGESLSIDGSSWWRDSDVAPDLLQRLYSILTDPDNARPDESWASVLAKVELELKRDSTAEDGVPEPASATDSEPVVEADEVTAQARGV